jgi:hypothetical protein
MYLPILFYFSLNHYKIISCIKTKDVRFKKNEPLINSVIDFFV